MRSGLGMMAIATALLLTACAPPATPSGVPTPATSTPASPTAPATSTAATSSAKPATAAPEPTGFPRISLARAWSGFSQPLYVTAPSDGSGRVYVVEKTGTVRSISGGRVDPQPFLDVSGKVSSGSEQGLLSIAFPPGAAGSKRVYAYYTDASGDCVISRFSISGGRATGEHTVLVVPHSAHPNHNGGQLQFGPDGYLYIGTGDGGSEGDPDRNGQNLGVLASKLLRVDVEGVGNRGRVPGTFTIPRSNPFVGRAGAVPSTWAFGLRNPWRFSFDAKTGDLYIGDVGQDSWEEIDFQPAGSGGGKDYGWSLMEGFHPYNAGTAPQPLTPPVTEYSHALGNAVVGGYVYRGSESPALGGCYLFADNGSGRVWGMRHLGGKWVVRQLLDTGLSLSGFGEDAARELYVCDLGGGVVYHVRAK